MIGSYLLFAYLLGTICPLRMLHRAYSRPDPRFNRSSSVFVRLSVVLVARRLTLDAQSPPILRAVVPWNAPTRLATVRLPHAGVRRADAGSAAIGLACSPAPAAC